MANTKNKTKETKTEGKRNTLTMTLNDSAGNQITIDGSCTDKEIKRICKTIDRTGDKIVKINTEDQRAMKLEEGPQNENAQTEPALDH